VNVNFSHNYFDPPGFTGIQERVFCANGAVDLVKATFQPRDSREPRKLDVPNADKDASYMSLDAFISNVRGRRTPLNNVESAFNSTLLPLMATRAIYEQRVVAWEEMLKG
jgi:hypothetical protein